MCGIVGVGAYDNLAMTLKGRDIFQNLLVADSARGIDGTGIMKVHRNGGVETVKLSGDPFSLFRSEGFQKVFWEPTTSRQYVQWLVGHNRWATTGKNTTKNAHPFKSEHIYLVHNGTLRSKTSFKEYKEYEVDSEALAASIAKNGVNETLAKTEGAYAIVYYDFKEQTLNMVRNYERPLWIGYDNLLKYVYFASEKEMLQMAVLRNKAFIEDIHEIPTHELHTWRLDGSEKFKPTITKVEHFSYWQGPAEKPAPCDADLWQGVNEDGTACSSLAQSAATVVPPFCGKYDYKEAKQQPYSKKGKTYSPPASQSLPYNQTKEVEKEKPKDFIQVGALNGLKQGDEIDVRYHSYDEIKNYKGDVAHWVMYCTSELFPAMDFRIRIPAPEENLWDAMGGIFIRGRVVSILMPSEQGFKKGNTQNVAYLHNTTTYSQIEIDKKEVIEHERNPILYEKFLKERSLPGTHGKVIVLPDTAWKEQKEGTHTRSK